MAQDTLLGFPAHTLHFRCGEFTALSTVSKERLCRSFFLLIESILTQTHCASIFSFSSVRYIHRSVFSSRAASSSACLACNSWSRT